MEETGKQQREKMLLQAAFEKSLLKKRRDDLPPSVATVVAPQMAHSSALQQKVCSPLARSPKSSSSPAPLHPTSSVSRAREPESESNPKPKSWFILAISPGFGSNFKFGLEDSSLSHEREGLRLQGAQCQAQEGDNIYGADATDAAKSMDATIAPAIAMKLPWAAVTGNHDQEGTLSREGVMHHLVGMKNTLSRFNPGGVEIDDYGNYSLEVGGVEGTLLANKSLFNLYFLDSGDYSIVPSMHGYGWIKASQQVWFQQTSWSLQTKYMNEQPKQKAPAPGLVYFHIPLPEFSSFTASNFTRVKKEGISSPSINSGFFANMVEAGDVKAGQGEQGWCMCNLRSGEW